MASVAGLCAQTDEPAMNAAAQVVDDTLTGWNSDSEAGVGRRVLVLGQLFAQGHAVETDVPEQMVVEAQQAAVHAALVGVAEKRGK